MRRLLSLALCCLLAAGVATAAAAATPPTAAAGFTPAQQAEIIAIVRHALQTDPSLLRDAITALQEQEAERKQNAEGEAIAALSADLLRDQADPTAGNPKAAVTVVEFFDPRCPYCRSMIGTVAALLAHHPDVRVVYKDIPILGASSVLAAKALTAAQAQGGFAKMMEAVMTGPADVSLETLHAAATKSGLDWAKMQKDMESPEVAKQLRANLTLARKLGIDGTPAYVIGAHIYPGLLSEEQMEEAVAAARKP
jgi:protein-disulfide isomerase